MQDIYTYIPETNHVPREYSGAAILSLLFMVPISLVPALVLMYLYVSTFRSMCAVPNVAVFCSSSGGGGCTSSNCCCCYNPCLCHHQQGPIDISLYSDFCYGHFTKVK